MGQIPLSEGGGKSPRISLRLPREQHARVVELAQTAGRTPSELVRRAIARELERETGPPPDDG